MNVVSLFDIETINIVNLWNEELGSTFPLTEALWKQNTVNEMNVLKEASIAILDQGELLGFVVAKQYQENVQAKMSRHVGWIQCLLVKQSARNRGIGETMLVHVEKVLKKNGITEIRIGRDPWHYFPGVPKEDVQTIEWFTKRGYVCESIETDLVKDVHTSVPYTLTNSVEHYRVLTQQDIPVLLEFLERAFPGRWHYEAIHYALIPGTGREFVGFFIDDELKGFCRINDPNSPVIAQNVYWSSLFEGTLGGIGPLGIDRSVRGHHYGLDLVKAAANELMKREVDAIVIDWTQLVSFYERLGFSPWKQYQTMSKSMSTLQG